MRGSFRQTGQTRIEYDFTIPKNTPPGKIRLGSLALFDRKGNRTRINHWSQSSGAPFFTVERGDASDYFEDTEGPELFGAYFEKSFVTAKDPSQKLFIRARDKSGLADYVGTFFYDHKRGDDAMYSTCTRWSTKLTRVTQDLYYVEGTTAECFSSNERGAPHVDLVYVQEITVYDRVGNPTNKYTNPVLAADRRIPLTRFELTK
jgi:hypothetical protein